MVEGQGGPACEVITEAKNLGGEGAWKSELPSHAAENVCEGGFAAKSVIDQNESSPRVGRCSTPAGCV